MSRLETAAYMMFLVFALGCIKLSEPTPAPSITDAKPANGDEAAQGSAAPPSFGAAPLQYVPDAFGVQPTEFTSQHAQTIDQPVSGYSRGRGLAIIWGSQNASPLDVVDATLDRLRHIQTTPSASDKTSRTIWRLEQARDELLGQAVGNEIFGDAPEETEE